MTSFDRQERLVRGNVHLCVSGIVERMQRDSEDVAETILEALPGPTYALKCDECEHEWEADVDVQDCPECDEDVGTIVDEVYPEIYEWWAITDWFADRLEAHNECVVRDFWGLTLWGRQTTGQSIAADHVLKVIADEVDAEIAEMGL